MFKNNNLNLKNNKKNATLTNHCSLQYLFIFGTVTLDIFIKFIPVLNFLVKREPKGRVHVPRFTKNNF